MRASATFSIGTDSLAKLRAVFRFLHEMGFSPSIERIDTGSDDITSVSEKSLEEAWLSEEDHRWDKLYKD